MYTTPPSMFIHAYLERKNENKWIEQRFINSRTLRLTWMVVHLGLIRLIDELMK